ncbi:hypothetical protein, partial [Streptomyces smyrnaeus]|uniref:hypothetical protein n=1 Tax=Streptomyces smyrnaeus TaxID=1387713 RepID=UPI0036BF796B
MQRPLRRSLCVSGKLVLLIHDVKTLWAATGGRLQTPAFRGHLIWLGRLLGVVGIVEWLVPDELWELFQQ